MDSDRGPPLPGDRPDQVYVSVKAIKVGTMELPDLWLFQDAYDAKVPDTVRTLVPTYAFLLEHPTKGKAMFDLGIRKVSISIVLCAGAAAHGILTCYLGQPDGEGVAPAMQELVRYMVAKCDKDVVDVLQSGGIEPEDIDSIIFRCVIPHILYWHIMLLGSPTIHAWVKPSALGPRRRPRTLHLRRARGRRRRRLRPPNLLPRKSQIHHPRAPREPARVLHALRALAHGDEQGAVRAVRAGNRLLRRRLPLSHRRSWAPRWTSRSRSARRAADVRRPRRGCVSCEGELLPWAPDVWAGHAFAQGACEGYDWEADEVGS